MTNVNKHTSYLFLGSNGVVLLFAGLLLCYSTVVILQSKEAQSGPIVALLLISGGSLGAPITCCLAALLSRETKNIFRCKLVQGINIACLALYLIQCLFGNFWTLLVALIFGIPLFLNAMYFGKKIKSLKDEHDALRTNPPAFPPKLNF